MHPGEESYRQAAVPSTESKCFHVTVKLAINFPAELKLTLVVKEQDNFPHKISKLTFTKYNGRRPIREAIKKSSLVDKPTRLRQAFLLASV